MNPSATTETQRVLVVGRSPSVLVDTVDILRRKGYSADATNQFDRVLDDYDVTDIDILVFGGMVPPDTRQSLREQISARNGHVRFVQGLAGIAGLIAAQVDSITSTGDAHDSRVTYDEARRTVQVSLDKPAHVRVEAWWATSFTPPEPRSTSTQVADEQLAAGLHLIPLPAQIPSEASFAAVSVGSIVHVFTVGAMPHAVLRAVPTSGAAAGGAAPPPSSSALPPVRAVTTHSDNRPSP